MTAAQWEQADEILARRRAADLLTARPPARDQVNRLAFRLFCERERVAVGTTRAHLAAEWAGPDTKPSVRAFYRRMARISLAAAPGILAGRLTP
jgi:hypothetical protein